MKRHVLLVLLEYDGTSAATDPACVNEPYNIKTGLYFKRTPYYNSYTTKSDQDRNGLYVHFGLSWQRGLGQNAKESESDVGVHHRTETVQTEKQA
jgi:hypothetical protein